MPSTVLSTLQIFYFILPAAHGGVGASPPSVTDEETEAWRAETGMDSH